MKAMEGQNISVVLPCRNERATLRGCLRDIEDIARTNGWHIETIVSDSSTDGSDAIAREEGAILVKHDTEGYGFAIRAGAAKATGDILVYADADGTYSFRELPQLVRRLESANIVIGSRLKGAMAPGAMPLSHRMLGTPVINLLLFIFFGLRVSDSQSGYRALKMSAFRSLDCRTDGMEFATEMLIKSKRAGLRITEVPVSYAVRQGTSKLRRYHDGLAHLRYIALEIPLLWYVGLAIAFFATGVIALALPVSSATLRIIFPVVGVEIFFAGVFTKTFLGVRFGEKSPAVARFHEIFRFNTGVAIGAALILVPAVLKIAGLPAYFFDVLFVSVIIGSLLILNLFILSVLNATGRHR